MDSENRNTWVIVSLVIIWVVVLITSLQAPALRFGDDPVVIRAAALVNWFWGLAGSVYVLRATIFRRPTEPGWGDDTAWRWIALAVGIIWVSVLIVSLTFPDVVIDSGFVEIPFGSIAAPVIGVALTSYVVDFLVTGFAARNAGLLADAALEPHMRGPIAEEAYEEQIYSDQAYENQFSDGATFDDDPTREVEVSYLESNPESGSE